MKFYWDFRTLTKTFARLLDEADLVVAKEEDVRRNETMLREKAMDAAKKGKRGLRFAHD
jgi:hypothetical protein